MKIYELDETPEYLKITDFDNFFDIYSVNNNIMFNLNSTLYLNIPNDLLEDFILTHNMHWPLLSYQIYGTPRLAWLLMKINKVKAENIFEIKYASDTVKYIPMQYVQQNILQYLNGY